MAKKPVAEPSYYFDCYGPFGLEHKDREISSDKKYLRDMLEERDERLSGAIGCYLFGLRFATKTTPWYAGMTVAKGGFISEVLQPHKRDIYGEAMAQQPRGTPVLFLFPLLTLKEERFSSARSSGRPVILWLERTLMGLAYGRNPLIGNLRDMHFLRNVQVEGLLGPRRAGRQYNEIKEIRRTLLGAR